MSNSFDVIVAGGGVAGSALGLTVQRRGMRVLIVEATEHFRDRVRGEGLHPWGVVEAQRLGLEQLMAHDRTRQLRYWDTYIGGARIARRDLVATTLDKRPELGFHHPEFQTLLLACAEQAGAVVRRGSRVTAATPGSMVRVELSSPQGQERVTARLLVVADGGSSRLRTAFRVPTEVLPPAFCVSGLLLADGSPPESVVAMCFAQGFDALSLAIPLPPAETSRLRLYLVQPLAMPYKRYAGPGDVIPMLNHCQRIGVPTDAVAGRVQQGPLASFVTSCTRLHDVQLPPGVAFVGDAAGTVDPVFGSGLSMALRDVRYLAGYLEHTSAQWPAALDEYHRERRRYHARQLQVEGWLARILFTQGAKGEALRALALPRLEGLKVDLVGLGPDSAVDAETEAALFQHCEA